MDRQPSPVSPRLLATAPHRLMFFIGASNLLLAMGWWAAWLIAARWPGLSMPQPDPYAGWLHAFVMQYQVLPSFFFGFLLTTFPKWMGLPDVERWRYLPVGAGLFGGQLATLLGAIGWNAGIAIGLLMTLAGWLAGLLILGRLLWQDRSGNWHARSCFAALALGGAGLLCWTAFVLGGAPPLWAFASIKIGSFGLLLPVYLTVAHRMFPFFASRVVPGYQPWRPLWLLAAFWPLALGHLVLELIHAYGWLWLVDAPLLALTSLMLWRWWPRGDKPGILSVLFIGLAWLPLAFALYLGQSIAYEMTGVYWLGRGPAHALFVGFFGSVLVAMVTRVTQGHSGRPLVMPAVAWFAFVAIQVVAAIRVAAEVLPDSMAWHAVAALGWLVAFAPWVVRIGRIYLTPRTDGKPG
ncbi:MAG: NnrS family protein [Lysobacter sp.]